MTVIKNLFLIFLVVAFLSGIYVCGTYVPPYKEGLKDSSGNNSRDSSGNKVGLPSEYWNDKSNIGTNNKLSQGGSCPDLLIRSGNSLLLYNSKKPKVDGVNPIPFYNLDEYIYYLEIQRKNGLHCPVLYLQEEVDTQGQTTYRVRQNPFQPDTLPPNVDLYRNPIPIMNLDSNLQNPPYNTNMYPSFDPQGQYIGRYTQLDAIHDATFKGSPLSDNPMDENWGGVLYTKSAVDSGKYKENEVAPPTAKGPWSLPSDNIRDDNTNTDIFA